MDAALKQRWVKALRSGRYEQTVELLSAVEDGREANCCLGVLCRVARLPRDHWQDEVDLSSVEYHDEVGNVVGTARTRFALDDLHERELVRRNDNGSSFSEIADYIEANL